MQVTAIEKINEESLNRIRQHPFILDALSGKLSKESAERWIMCAGRESRTFPDILKKMISWVDNEKIKSILQENYDDELGNGNPDEAHFLHYLHLLRDLGIDRNVFFNYSEKAGIKLAVNLAHNVAESKNAAIVIGYMLVNEAMTPITYLAVKSAITKYYPNLATNFFDVHISVDEHHVAELIKAIEELDESNYSALLFGINIGERGMAVLLDEAYSVFDHYNDDIAFDEDYAMSLVN